MGIPFNPLAEVSPQCVERAAVCCCSSSSYPADLSDFQRLTTSAANRDDLLFVPRKIQYRPLSLHKAALLAEVRTAVKALADHVDYFRSPRGVLAVLPEHDDILLTETLVPLIVGATEDSVRKGALLHVTGDPTSQGQDAAAIALAILEGAAPGTIPPSLPGKIQFAINLKRPRTCSGSYRRTCSTWPRVTPIDRGSCTCDFRQRRCWW